MTFAGVDEASFHVFFAAETSFDSLIAPEASFHFLMAAGRLEANKRSLENRNDEMVTCGGRRGLCSFIDSRRGLFSFNDCRRGR